MADDGVSTARTAISEFGSSDGEFDKFATPRTVMTNTARSEADYITARDVSDCTDDEYDGDYYSSRIDDGTAGEETGTEYESAAAGYETGEAPPAPAGYYVAEDAGTGVSDKDVADIFSFARHNRFNELSACLDRGVPVSVRDQFGNTILAIACQNGNKRIAKLALRHGADINAANVRVGNSVAVHVMVVAPPPCELPTCPLHLAERAFMLICGCCAGETA